MLAAGLARCLPRCGARNQQKMSKKWITNPWSAQLTIWVSAAGPAKARGSGPANPCARFPSLAPRGVKRPASLRAGLTFARVRDRIGGLSEPQAAARGSGLAEAGSGKKPVAAPAAPLLARTFGDTVCFCRPSALGTRCLAGTPAARQGYHELQSCKSLQWLRWIGCRLQRARLRDGLRL